MNLLYIDPSAENVGGDDNLLQALAESVKHLQTVFSEDITLRMET